MAFSPAALGDLFRRDKVKDPFGGDDLYDGESRLAGKGPKIALAASGALFLLLGGGIAAIFVTSEETIVAPLVAGSFADLEIAEDIESPEALAPPPAAGVPPAAVPAANANPSGVVTDSTAATDRSVDRRPWLSAPPPAPVSRPGVAEAVPKPVAPGAAPPAAKPAEVKIAQAKAPAVAPPAVPPPAVSQHAAPAPAATAPTARAPAVPPPAKPAESKTVATVAPPSTTMPAGNAPKPVSLPPPTATPSAAPTMKAAIPPEPMPAAEDLDPAREIAGIPALQAPGLAPGAPRPIDRSAGNTASTAGGRPQLVEPPLPPTDKIALSAPPPRYANLTDIKRDAATPTAPAASAIRVAFIVQGLGLSQTSTDAAINKLTAAVTLSFSPYARDLKKWIEKAKAKGHEVLVEVPMESEQFPAEDPGPLGLLTSTEAKDNQMRLDAILKESGGAVGILDSMGSRFRKSGEHIGLLFATLKQGNLFYVQGTPGVRVGEATVPTAIADLIIDERPFRAAIDARLDFAERLAKYQGSAIAALGAKPVSYERLVLWLEQAQKKGVTLAPISQVLIK